MGNLLSPGVKEFCLYDNVNNNAYLIDGNSIDPGSTLEAEQLTRGVNSRGGVEHLNERWSLNLNFSDASQFTTLQGLAKDRNYRLVIVLLNGFVFWDENQKFALNESALFDPAAEDYPFTLTMTHVSKDPSIEQKFNAASPWEDSDGNLLADNWVITNGSVTASFSANVQSLGDGTPFRFERKWIMPFPGLSLSAGLSFNQLHDDGTNEFGFRFYDSAGTLLSSDMDTISTTGRKTKTVTLPANTYEIGLVAEVTGNTVNNFDLQLENPALRVIGTDWVNY